MRKAFLVSAVSLFALSASGESTTVTVNGHRYYVTCNGSNCDVRSLDVQVLDTPRRKSTTEVVADFAAKIEAKKEQQRAIELALEQARAAAPVAQAPPPTQPREMLDGDTWMLLSAESRVAWVSAFGEGMSVQAAMSSTRIIDWLDCGAYSPVAISGEIDAVYKHSKYRTLPVVEAMRLVILRIRGTSEDEVWHQADVSAATYARLAKRP